MVFKYFFKLGIFCFRNLEKLDCSFNFISDLIELSMCHTLTSVNLSNNEVEEEDNISFLASLSGLTYINISNKSPRSDDRSESTIN